VVCFVLQYISADYLDWLKHYFTIGQRQPEGGEAEALTVLSGAYEALLPIDKHRKSSDDHSTGGFSRPHLVAATIQMYIYEVQAARGQAALSATTEALSRALEHLESAGVMVEEGNLPKDQNDSQAKGLLLRAWKALSKLSHTVSVPTVVEALSKCDELLSGTMEEWPVVIVKG